MKFIITVFFSLFIILNCQGNDTLRVMYYNVLRFPSGDTPSRVDTLEKIFQHYKPDVLVVCELESASGANSILNNALNVGGAISYSRANFVSNGSGFDNSQNMLFYNNNKLTLLGQDEITTSVRDINEYRLYYSDVDFAVQPDTIFFDFYAAHLKASQGSDNEDERKFAVDQLKAHLEGADLSHNIIFGGDFNVYTSSEPAYQTLLESGSVLFYDPISSPGNWHNSSSYAPIHTQSTRTVQIDGGATGGLDDRFDFILTTANVLSGSENVSYIPGTYKAAGNDGNHFNTDLITGTNTAAPASIISALYYGSDHLPVMMDLSVLAVPDTTPVIPGDCDELFFSEYIEGSSNNKALEVYNPGSEPVILDGYSVKTYNNGASTPTNTAFLSGSLASGEVLTIVNASADPAIATGADLFSEVTFFNGDDAVGLYNGALLIDVIGQIGTDPGASWPVGSGSTVEFTLIRKANVQEGETDWAAGASQWNVFSQNYFDDFGMHTMDACLDPTPTCGPDAIIQNLSASPAPNGTNVSLSWDALSGATFYQAKGRRSGTVPFGQFITPNTTKNIGGLMQGTMYEWKIRAQCEDESITTFTDLSIFTTASLKVMSELGHKFNLFPVPASDLLHVSIVHQSDATLPFQIYSTEGKILIEGSLKSQSGFKTTDIPISDLNDGMYFFSVLKDGIWDTQHFIKMD